MTNRQAIVALEDAVRFFDLQDPSNDRTIFRLHNPKTQILDLCKPAHDACDSAIRVIVTTDEIIWIDIGNAALGSEPVLRYRLRRSGDSTLSLSTTFVGGVHHTFLWSRQTSHVTVFCYTETLPVQLLGEPYVLNAARPGFQRTGLALLGSTNSEQRGLGQQLSITMMEQSSDGEVFEHKLVASSAEPAVVDVSQTRVEQSAVAHEEPGAVEVRKHRVTDFRKIYSSKWTSESCFTCQDQLC